MQLVGLSYCHLPQVAVRGSTGHIFHTESCASLIMAHLASLYFYTTHQTPCHAGLIAWVLEPQRLITFISTRTVVLVHRYVGGAVLLPVQELPHLALAPGLWISALSRFHITRNTQKMFLFVADWSGRSWEEELAVLLHSLPCISPLYPALAMPISLCR